MPVPTFQQVLIVSAALRIALILYSEYHDAHAVVKYTDVDYRVFTDAARLLLNRNNNGSTIAQGIWGKYLNIGEYVFLCINLQLIYQLCGY